LKILANKEDLLGYRPVSDNRINDSFNQVQNCSRHIFFINIVNRFEKNYVFAHYQNPGKKIKEIFLFVQKKTTLLDESMEVPLDSA